MPQAAYDAIAGWYDQVVREGALTHDLVLPNLLDLLGEVAGLTVCDLACGQGVLARDLARRGARIVGIDLSAELLAIARRIEADAPLGIAYEQGDAQALPAVADAAFDAVACAMALMDIPDLAATFRTVHRILRPGGRFVFAITHPCFEAPHSWWAESPDGSPFRAVVGYFDEGFWRSANPNGVRHRVGAHHRTLSTYLTTLAEAGFTLERTTEPRPTDRLAERVPGYRVAPPALFVRCRK